MRRLLLTVLAAGALAHAAAAVLADDSAQGDAAGRERSSREGWVYQSMLEMGRVKAGMTRADLLKVFREEGGLSTRTRRTYAYGGCRYFKVDVRFEPAGGAGERLGESPDDRIVEISRPYLAHEILD
jgi:hypothetical protein